MNSATIHRFSTLPMPSSPNDEAPNGPRSFTEQRQVAGTSDDLVQLLVTRPPVYYGNGPFDPPSSDDEDQEPTLDAQHEFEDDVETISLLTRTPVTPGHAETGGLSSLQSRSGTEKVIFDSCLVAKAKKLFQRRSTIRILGYTLVSLVVLAGVIGTVAGFMYSEMPYSSVGRRRLTMDHMFNWTFSANQPDLNWVAEGMTDFLLNESESHDL